MVIKEASRRDYGRRERGGDGMGKGREVRNIRNIEIKRLTEPFEEIRGRFCRFVLVRKLALIRWSVKSI